MPTEQSYGIIPLELRDGVWYVFLIQHSAARYWGFPKGHQNQGETPRQTAERELFEETGLHVLRYFDEKALTTNYRYTREGKIVDKSCGYFVAEVAGVVNIQVEEVSGNQWIPVLEASKVLTHALDKEILKQVLL